MSLLTEACRIGRRGWGGSCITQVTVGHRRVHQSRAMHTWALFRTVVVRPWSSPSDRRHWVEKTLEADGRVVDLQR